MNFWNLFKPRPLRPKLQQFSKQTYGKIKIYEHTIVSTVVQAKKKEFGSNYPAYEWYRYKACRQFELK